MTLLLGAAPPRRHDHRPTVALRFPVVIWALLAVLSLAGGYWKVVIDPRRATVERMGPAGNFAALPPITVGLGGSREVDLKLLVELGPGVRPAAIAPFTDRIVERVAVTVGAAGPEALRGRDGALLVKQAVTSALKAELPRTPVKGVLVESMVVR